MKLGLATMLVASASALVGCGSEAGSDDAAVVDQAQPSDEPSQGGTTSTSSADAPPSNAPADPAKLGAPYPVVLLHGMSGFGTLEVGPIAVTYFNGVVEDLTKNGESVFVTLAPPYDTSEVRAAAIAKQIDFVLQRTGKAKVNVIGHSQGGLDARVLASPNGLGYGDRIASVTTIATPHRGSKIADVSLGLMKLLPASVIDGVTGGFLELLQKTAFELQADANLRAQVTAISEQYMTNVFNPKYVDDSRVVYQSYGGRTNLRTGVLACGDGLYPNDPTDLDVAQGPLAVLAAFLEDGKLEVNDGLVTVASSKWGTFQQCVAADHLKEVGQLGALASSFDHRALFRDIVGRLRSSGL
jgi:triacylglycerol lipase